MKINDRGQAVWDNEEYIQGLIDADEAERLPRIERPNPSWGPEDSARWEAQQEAKRALEEWEAGW